MTSPSSLSFAATGWFLDTGYWILDAGCWLLGTGARTWHLLDTSSAVGLMFKCVKDPNGISFKVYVQPKASKNKIVGLHGDALKVRLTAPPVDGAANKMCLKYLAKCLSVPASSLEILSGQTSRTKHILLKNDPAKTGTADFKQLKHRIESSLLPKETA